MKATEIQIGDWVYLMRDDTHISKPIKIDWIRTGEIGFYDSGELCSVAIGAIEPIPLTAELLEKNPLIKEQGYWDKESDLFRLFACPVINLYSVNRCQHALRLCGLDELADNFKID